VTLATDSFPRVAPSEPLTLAPNSSAWGLLLFLVADAPFFSSLTLALAPNASSWGFSRRVPSLSPRALPWDSATRLPSPGSVSETTDVRGDYFSSTPRVDIRGVVIQCHLTTGHSSVQWSSARHGFYGTFAISVALDVLAD
jgi:hypothetical protein